MAGLSETPKGERVHIAFFGLRNAGKSTLVNEFTLSPIAIVSDVPGTTTDPVSKAMEIKPLGPCLVTDTAGLDDTGELGAERVRRTLEVLRLADVAVWVAGANDAPIPEELKKAKIPIIVHRRGDTAEDLRAKIAALDLDDVQTGLLDGLVKKGDHVLCVCPIDEAAPKGRLILPQVQVIRAALDVGARVTVVKPEDVENGDYALVVTDSQAFAEVSKRLPPSAPLTGFSILFARQKGDIGVYVSSLGEIGKLKDGDTVLVAEGCTHHRQCNDIGSVKIPAALKKLSGKNLRFEFASGDKFALGSDVKLVVQCGGCMLSRREVLRRIGVCRDAGIPIVNYGMVLALAAGVEIERCVK